MKSLIFVLLTCIIADTCYAQVSSSITERRNIYNKKGNYYFDKNEFDKAIVFYNMAFRNDPGDYFSVLRKAEAYTRLNMFVQAEECYRYVFETNMRTDNSYRLRYALVLLENNKTEEFKKWLDIYSKIVEDETESENILVPAEDRIKLYKDSSIVLVTNESGLPKIDTLRFKIRYAGFRPRRKASAEDNQLNIILGSGEEHFVAADAAGNFKFGFQPMEQYKLVIQKENIHAENILSDKGLTEKQRRTQFLNPPPLQKAEIILLPGMKYEFTSGETTIDANHRNILKEKSQMFQKSGNNIIDITALLKEMQFEEGDIYTIRFIKDESQVSKSKKIQVSTLFYNDNQARIFGQPFFMVMPLKSEINFTIQNDLDVLDKNFSPKKYSLIIDDSPVFEGLKKEASENMISLTVNTNSINEVRPPNRLSAQEISIIPGTEYILSLSKPDPFTGRDIEVIVPLTRGVRYNLAPELKPDAKYKLALAEFLTGREKIQPVDEEIIDISILSKELEVKPGEELTFTLLPVKKPGKQTETIDVVKSNLTVDEKVFEISRDEKYSISIPFRKGRIVNLRTDLDYLLENFDESAYNISLDTFSFTSEITIDTTGYGSLKSTGWLSLNVNTVLDEEVTKHNRFMAKEVSIIPGKEYILTVIKTDAVTGKKDEIFIPLLRNVKYDFTSNLLSEEEFKNSLKEFIAGRENLKTIDGTLIDITLLSKELRISEDDEVSFSLLPVRKLTRQDAVEATDKSALYLDNKLVEFTYIHKYTIYIPLSEDRQMNVKTNLEFLQEHYDPASYTINIDTLSFFSEIIIDTAGLGDRVIKEEEIKDPVFDIIVVNFDLNRHTLSPDAMKTIQQKVIDKLKSDMKLYVTIKGYTDALGDAGYNLILSERRAESVKEFLKNNGIGENRIRTYSFGASQFLEEGIQWKDLSEAELRKYRKVEIVMYLPE